jgi:hypothetical protein
MQFENKPSLALLFAVLAISINGLVAQPQSGDIFREYPWTVSTEVNNEPYLRVCGDGYYEDQTRKGKDLFKPGFVNDGWINFPQSIDLQDAVKAELVVEKMLCHDGSTGLAFKINESTWMPVPESAHIPMPQAEYLHHYNATVAVPIQVLKSGTGNRFRFTIDQQQRWGMPQNMVYGLVLRVYYKATKAHLKAEISSIKSGDVLGEKVTLQVKNEQQKTPAKVEYIGLYDGLNLEGDGLYRQWHYHYHRGQLQDFIGAASKGQALDWSTEWIPDQDQELKIAARVTDENGVIYLSKAVDNLQLKRPYKVELCKPYDIPRRWATREREFQSAFDLKGKAQEAEKMQVVARTWSPGYLNGLYLNDYLLLSREACNYCYHTIKVDSKDVQHLGGMNTIKTGKTPLVKGKMVHGTEIQYPGFMVLVKYKAQ